MEILITDIETTGFLQQGGKIVEVGIVSLNLLTGEKKTLFDQVCHERPITKQEVEESWIVKNSDLTLDMIQKSKQLSHYIPWLNEIYKAYPLGGTAFNNAFDNGFLKSRGIIIGKELPCPMKLMTDICKIPKGSGYKWPNVMEAHKHLFGEIGYIEQHRGADDAWYEADIVYQLYKMGIFKLQ
jgi:DNA polymerase III alpha subunit (gram-positive type)